MEGIMEVLGVFACLYLLLGRNYREPLQTAANGRIFAQIDTREHTSTAVLGTADQNLLNCGLFGAW